MSSPEAEALKVLGARLQEIADAEDGEKETGGPFGTKPTRWWESAHWRCLGNHVSQTLLGTDEGKVCVCCRGQVWLTFPEDVDGPLLD